MLIIVHDEHKIKCYLAALASHGGSLQKLKIDVDTALTSRTV